MYRATASRIGDKPNEGRTFDDAETAAQNLLVLLLAAGWSGDREQAIETLARGGVVQFSRFEYRVTEEG